MGRCLAKRQRNRRNPPRGLGATTPTVARLSKEQRLCQIVNAKNNFYLGLAALALFQERATYLPLSGLSVDLSGKYGFNFAVVVEMLDHSEAGPNARHEFQLALLRMVLKETFEMVRQFAEEHSLMPALRAQLWYHPARILRNCVSHNCKFDFGPHDLRQLPLEWNGLTITAEMKGEDLTTDQCGSAFVKELVNDIEKFIRSADPSAAELGC